MTTRIEFQRTEHGVGLEELVRDEDLTPKSDYWSACEAFSAPEGVRLVFTIPTQVDEPIG